MALIDRNVSKPATVENQADTKRMTDVKIVKRDKLTVQERKNIKVSPETWNLIKAICTMKSMKNYEFVDEAVELYIKNNMSDREQRILKNLSSQKR